MPRKASTPRERAAAAKARARARKGKRKAPVMYTPELGEEICERLAAGERWSDMADTARMPGYSVPYKWAKRDREFGFNWRFALQIGANARADEVLTVAETATKETLPVDRVHIGALKWHVDRDTKLYGPRPDEPDMGAGRRLLVYVRRFERYIDETGEPQVRELPPPPAAPEGQGPEGEGQ